MKVILPSLAVFALSAGILCAQNSQTPQSAFRLPEEEQRAASGTAPTDGADLLIERMADACSRLESVQARIHFQANLFDQEIIGSGIYLQQGTGDDRKFRLELQIPLGQPIDQKKQVLVRVCDSQYLWQYEQFPEKENADAPARPAVTKTDIRRVRQALDQSQHPISAGAVHELTWGGLPKLLDGLASSFRFTSARDDQLESPSASGNGVQSLRVWNTTGSWRPEALRAISPGLANDAARGKAVNVNKLAPQAPDEVAIYAGQDDLFPYRIEFRRRVGKQGRGADAGPEEVVPIMQLVLFEVRLNAPIDREQFLYDHNAEDITGSVIKSLSGK